MRLLIVTAANEGFAPLLKGLVESLFQWGPLKQADLGVLDVGLSVETLKWLRGTTDRIVVPEWDLPVDPDLARKEPWLRAMTSRPFLPRYFPGYDLYLWLDADTWVQQSSALDSLVLAAGTGRLAIVPEHDRWYTQSAGAVKWRETRMREYFGSAAADGLQAQPYFNSGVFALAADAPHWQLWAKHFAAGLQAAHGTFSGDQTALNFAIRAEALPCHPLPARCNWLNHLARPEYLMSDGLFHEPGPPYDPIGIMHLTARTKDKFVEARGADGRVVKVSARFSADRPRDAAAGTQA